MRILFVLVMCLLSGINAPALAQADGGYGLSPFIQNRILGEEQDYTQIIRTRAPQFRLVREVETFSSIEGSRVDVPVTLQDSELIKLKRENSPPIVATLHDRRTGRPLDNCLAPCVLQSPMVPPGMLTLYRYGSEPINFGAETLAFVPNPVPISIGFNEIDHQIERERCAQEFAVIRMKETARDAEACVRLPPHMPNLATHSGHCRVVFNISRRGDPTDVRADECTEQIFCEPTTKSVRRWIYYPKLEYGETAERLGVVSTMRFVLTNFRGDHIPEPDGDMEPCVGSA